LDAIFESGAPAFAYLAPWNCDIVTQPTGEDMDQLGLGGYAASAMEEILQMTTSPESRQAADGALALLYRLARGENRSS